MDRRSSRRWTPLSSCRLAGRDGSTILGMFGCHRHDVAIGDRTVQRLKTDPARFEVVKNALTCAAEEMKIVLAKTAYSPLLKVAGDYSCGIFDTQGNMVAQGPDLPIHLGSMPDAVRAVIAGFPEVAAGGVFIHNEPYHAGSHLQGLH